MTKVNIIEVCFGSGSTTNIYSYKTIDSSINKDDKVVVFGYDGDPKIATVFSINGKYKPEIHYNWIIQKVDTTRYDELKALETIGIIDNKPDKVNLI